jgi:ribonuclease G
MIGLRKKTKREIIVNAESLETRVAIMEDGHLEEFAIERPTEERIVGSIYKGRIQNMEDGLQAAFVDIGMKKNAFIHYWDMIPEDAARLEAEEGIAANRPRKKKSQPGEMAKMFPPGSEIIVQVTKGPIGTKGPRVTANLSIPGRYLVMMPGSKLKGVSRKIEDAKERERLKKVLGRLPIPSSIGLIIRTSAEGSRATSFARDLRGLLDSWQKIEDGIKNVPAPCCLYHEPDLVERVVRDSLTEEVDRIVIDARETCDRIKDMTSRISRRVRNRVKLYDRPCRASSISTWKSSWKRLHPQCLAEVRRYLIFDEPSAVAIDVNTGAGTRAARPGNSPAGERRCRAGIARQLRRATLRGLVVIVRHRHEVAQEPTNVTAPQEAPRNTRRHQRPARSQLVLIEMTRQRMEESLAPRTTPDCP